MEEKKQQPVGRPTVMTDETVKKLEEAFSYGASDREACFLAGISGQTLYNYQELNPEFIERKAALKEMTKFQARKVVADKIVSADIDTAKWYLENKASDEFNKKSTQELIGKDGGPVKQSLTIEFIGNTDTKGV